MCRYLWMLLLVATVACADSGRVIGWIEIEPGRRVEAYEVGECLVFAQRFYKELGCPIPHIPDEKASSVFTMVESGAIKNFRAIRNGSPDKPQDWDAVVWSGGKYGHIAPIKEVGEPSVLVVEQNWAGRQGEVFLPLTVKDGSYSIVDRGSYKVLGWCRPLKGARPRAKPISTHFIIDASGSMNGVHGEALRDGLRKIPRYLDPEDTVQVSGFNKSVVPLLEATKGQAARGGLIQAADRYYPEGKTNVAVALRSVKGDSGQFTILVTDGVSTVEEVVPRATSKNLTIVGYGARNGEGVSQELARSLGARYLAATPRTLPGVLFHVDCLNRGENVIHQSGFWVEPKKHLEFPVVVGQARRLRIFASIEGKGVVTQLIEPSGKVRPLGFTYGAGGEVITKPKPGKWRLQIVSEGKEQAYVTASVSVQR